MIIVKTVFGSELYGTNTPLSDTDYKGIFLPTKKEVLLGRIPNSINTSTNKSNEKNSPDDVDIELYSLNYFVHLACQGETVALDMLHTPEHLILEKSRIWNKLVANREKFYTKNLKAFIGYARAQASKYGNKGIRLQTVDSLRNFLLKQNPLAKLFEIWDILPEGHHVHKYPATSENNNLRIYSVCGKDFQETFTVEYVLPTIKLMVDRYGARAQQAKDADGVDWKAISHALRVAMEVKELLTEKTITFPLKESYYLKDVKTGQIDFQIVSATLDALMAEVEDLMAKSDLPAQVDRKFWDEFLIDVLEENLFRKKEAGFIYG